jgi:dipeptidase
LDFTRIYSKGEYAHKFYSGRRVWGAFRLFGVPLPSNYTDLRYDAVYPVTAKPAAKVEVRSLMAIYRDYYEGTEFDLSKGLAAGPYGNPDRWSTSTSLKGNWERSIGLFRTTSINIVQCKRYGQGAVLWYAPHCAGAAVFIPLFARGTAVPHSYKVADPNTLNRESAYWAHQYVFNVAKLRYDMAIKDVRRVQWQLEDEGVSQVLQLDEVNKVGAAALDRASDELAAKILRKSWELPDHLIFKYADGFLKDGGALGYPDWWLKQVGYEQGPPPVPQQCADDVVEKCTGACPLRGFATCAAKCVNICDTQAVV